MKISIVLSSNDHPIYPYLQNWIESEKDIHDITLINNLEEVSEGDFLFLVSCHEYIRSEIRKNFKYSLVLHASDLPKGRGWSPHIWDIIGGSQEITLTLLEAADDIDSGNIWAKAKIPLEGHELFDEINHLLFTNEIELMKHACRNYKDISPIKQNHKEATYLIKRSPSDSELDLNCSISSQWNLIRVCDSVRFPCFVILGNDKYILKFSKVKSQHRKSTNNIEIDPTEAIGFGVNLKKAAGKKYFFSYLDFSYQMSVEYNN